MFKPKDMCKLTIAGPKTKRSDIVELIHKRGVVHIEDYITPADETEIDIGVPEKDASKISEILLKLRSIKAYLNIVKRNNSVLNKRAIIKNPTKEIDRINEEVITVLDEIKVVDESLAKFKIQKDVLQPLIALNLNAEVFGEYDNLSYAVGFLPNKVKVQDIIKNINDVEKTSQSYSAQYNDRTVFAVFTKKDSITKVKSILVNEGFMELSTQALSLVSGDSKEALKVIEKKTKELENKKSKFKSEFDSLGKKYSHFILENEEKYASILEKLEAPLMFAESKNAFVVEGWVPKKNYNSLKKDLDGVSGGKIYLKRSDDSKGAPTELENPKGVKPFEFFMGLYSLPKYTEVDPTFFMFLTFPLFFGFMLGDLGYGILTFIIFWVIRSKINSKELKPVLSVMMFASFMTAVFGYIFGEFFGAEHIFGYEMHPIFHRLHDPVGLFTMSIIIGVVHVNMGLIIGFYNEFKSHGIKAALLEKASWMILQLGALAYVTINSSVGGVVIIASIIMLAMGEGVKGILELPSILTNILSYARLMAVGLASAILALVVNEMAGSAFSAGTFGIIMGAIILVAGHTIAILLGMLSPFIHSMRLHYVEFFLKFYQGGGKEYKPFGREK